MSLQIGKRPYFDNPDLHLSSFSHLSLKSCKSIASGPQTFYSKLKDEYEKNLQKLEGMFPNKKRIDLEGLLGELNNNVELVIDLIKNEHTLDKGLSSNTKERSFLKVTTNRTANKPTQLDKRPQNKKPSESINQDKPKSEMMIVEKTEPVPVSSLVNQEESSKFAELLFKRLRETPDLNIAFGYIKEAFRVYDEMKSKEAAKIENQNTLLKSAFLKQNRKLQEALQENAVLKNSSQQNEEELQRAKRQLYILQLRLKSMDSKPELEEIQDIF